MDQPWKVIFAFVAVFVAGAVFGGFFTLRNNATRPSVPAPIAENKSGQPPRPALQQMTVAIIRQYMQRLNLTDEQRDKIRPIVAQAEEDLQRLRRQNFQDTARVMDRMHSDVAAWLTPEQVRELETIKGNMRERLRRAQENKDRRGEIQRGGLRGTGVPGARPAGEATAVDERKGN